MAKTITRPHTDTTLKLPSDFSATVKALLNTPPPPPATEILKAERPKRKGPKRR
jgi:hypothetical protein